jgi:hypothetical protein
MGLKRPPCSKAEAGFPCKHFRPSCRSLLRQQLFPIATTASYYTDNKRRIALPMADVLRGQPQAQEKPSAKETPAAGLDSRESAGKE